MSAVAHIDEYKKGTFYTDEYRGLMSWNGYETNVLLRNEGCDSAGIPHFTDVAMATGADDSLDARGVAVLDFDNDGDLDLAISHNPGDSGDPERARATLLRNDTGSRRAWFAIDLEGTRSNRDAVGAVVEIETGAGRQVRQVSAGQGYASQHGQRLYFGLGEQEQIDRLTVRWPSGAEQVFGAVSARQLAHLTEGEELELQGLDEG